MGERRLAQLLRMGGLGLAGVIAVLGLANAEVSTPLVVLIGVVALVCGSAGTLLLKESERRSSRSRSYPDSRT